MLDFRRVFLYSHYPLYTILSLQAICRFQIYFPYQLSEKTMTPCDQSILLKRYERLYSSVLVPLFFFVSSFSTVRFVCRIVHQIYSTNKLPIHSFYYIEEQIPLENYFETYFTSLYLILLPLLFLLSSPFHSSDSIFHSFTLISLDSYPSSECIYAS